MFSRSKTVCFLAGFPDACALWRMQFPHQNIPGSHFYCFAGNPDFDLVAMNDIVVVQRCCTKPQFDMINLLAELGHKIVYDLDDNIWSIESENPASGILSRYKDGFNYCVRNCDAVTVSTKVLAKTLKNNVRNMINIRTARDIPIIVAENWIDERIFSDPIPSDGRIVVGWQGSTSHIPDLRIIEPTVRKLAAEMPEVTFQFRGLEPPPSLLEMPNIEHKLWMPVAEYPSRMPTWGWSIAMAPVTDHEFNLSKSNIKMQEAAYCKIPCLASWMNPYEYFCSFDPELRWLLCAGPSNWEPKLRELIHDEARRRYLGERMHRVMREHFSFNREHPGWKRAFEAVA